MGFTPALGAFALPILQLIAGIRAGLLARDVLIAQRHKNIQQCDPESLGGGASHVLRAEKASVKKGRDP
jgi:hypothetical protein